jgi:hypothetical protein
MQKQMLRTLVLTATTLAVVLGLGACSLEERAATVKSEAQSATTDEAPAAGTGDVVVEEAADDAVVEAEEAQDAEPDAPQTAALGDTVDLDSWDVKVTEVALDADAVVAKANQFNDRPKGVYVLVTYEATYTGAERTADVWSDLTWSFTTTDARVNDPAYQVTPADNQEWPTEARSGGTVRQQVLFDLPADRLTGGILTVEGYDEDYDTVYADFAV